MYPMRGYELHQGVLTCLQVISVLPIPVFPIRVPPVLVPTSPGAGANSLRAIAPFSITSHHFKNITVKNITAHCSAVCDGMTEMGFVEKLAIQPVKTRASKPGGHHPMLTQAMATVEEVAVGFNFRRYLPENLFK